MSKINSPCWLCCHSWKMVNGLFANKGPQATKAAGANTQQHVLKKLGERATRTLWCCWSWADHDLNTSAGKWSWGTHCGRQEREDQQREVQNLHFWHSPSLVATPNDCRSCTDMWVLLRSRTTTPSLWIPTVLNKIMIKKHLHPPVFSGFKERKWRQHMWRDTQRGNLKSCSSHRQRQKILSLYS